MQASAKLTVSLVDNYANVMYNGGDAFYIIPKVRLAFRICQSVWSSSDSKRVAVRKK